MQEPAKPLTFAQIMAPFAATLLFAGICLLGITALVIVAGPPIRHPRVVNKDGTQVRNLVQACFTYAATPHPQSTAAEDAAMDAMQAEAVVEPVDSHHPPAK